MNLSCGILLASTKLQHTYLNDSFKATAGYNLQE